MRDKFGGFGWKVLENSLVNIFFLEPNGVPPNKVCHLPVKGDQEHGADIILKNDRLKGLSQLRTLYLQQVKINKLQAKPIFFG